MGRMKANIHGSSKLKRHLRKGRRDVHRKGEREVERESQRAVFNMKQNVIENDSVASTELFRSFVRKGDPWLGGHTIKNKSDHAAYVEFGTGFYHKPHPAVPVFTAPDSAPPIVPHIRQWIFQKPTMAEGDPWAIAKAIADGTPKHPPGTPAAPFFLPVWENTEKIIKARLKQLVARAW